MYWFIQGGAQVEQLVLEEDGSGESLSEYDNTLESKMSRYNEAVFISSFEEREDDAWYLTLVPTDNYLNRNANRDRTIRTFKASDELSILTAYVAPRCTAEMEDFETYYPKLTKATDSFGNSYFWNPLNNDPDHIKTGFYYAYVVDGLLTELEEVQYTCGG